MGEASVKPMQWTCSACRHYDKGECGLLGGTTYWFNFCDGYEEDDRDANC